MLSEIRLSPESWLAFYHLRASCFKLVPYKKISVLQKINSNNKKIKIKTVKYYRNIQIKISQASSHWYSTCTIKQWFIGDKAKWRISKEVTRKQRTSNFPNKRTFLTPWYAHVRVYAQLRVRIRSKKCSFFFGKFDVLYFLVTSVLRFAFLPYYRRIGALPNIFDKIFDQSNSWLNTGL